MVQKSKTLFVMLVCRWGGSSNACIKCVHKVGEKERNVEKEERGKKFLLRFSRVYWSLRSLISTST